MIKLKYLFILLILIIPLLIKAQGNLNVLIKPPPTYQFHLEHMWNVTLVNPTQTTYRVYLKGSATKTDEGLIALAHTSIFTLPHGTTVVNATEVNPIHLDQSNSKYEKVVKNLGAVPDGNYDICVSVINAADETVLGTDCISIEVLNLTQIELISPSDGTNLTAYSEPDESKFKNKNLPPDNSKILDKNILLPIFQWTPPVTVGSAHAVTYKLKIAQIFASQSAYDAMQSNPMFYSEDKIRTTVVQYPIASRSLSNGKYSWQVEAYVDGVLLSQSEIWEFKIGTEQPIKDAQLRASWFKKYWSDAGITYDYSIEGASLDQKKKSPFIFLFSSILFGENANRQGTGSDKPAKTAYWEMTPSLSLYGIPLSTSILLSSENSGIRQSINSLGLNLDGSTIKNFIMQKIDDKKNEILENTKKDFTNMTEKQKDNLENEAANKVKSSMSPFLKLMSYFPAFGIGTTYPDYSPLTVRGVPLTGANIEFNPGWFYVAAGGFQNQRPIDNSTFKRNIYTGRLGIGQKDGNHLFFTALYGKDDPNSINVDPSNNVLTPKSNYLFGIQGELDFLKKMLSFEGEISGAMLTRDNRDADLENKSIPQWVKNMVHPKISSSVDYSYSFKGSFNNEKSKTKISAGIKMLGPGYSSFGVPNLSTDKFEVETKFSQSVLQNKISFSGFIKWFKDNLIDWKSSTTSNTILGLTTNIRFKNLPYFVINYTPMFQKNNASDNSLKVNNKFHILTFMSGYGYNKWDVFFNSSLSYTLNTGRAIDSTNNVTSNNLILNQTLSFKIPLTISGSFGTNFSKYSGDYSRILSGDASISYLFFKLLNFNLGMSTAFEKDKNKKIMFYSGASIGIQSYLTIEIRAEKNIYKDWLNSINNYDEFLTRATVSTTF